MNRCKHISHFCKSAYHFLTETFSFRLGFSELGMTDHLVIDLAKYTHYHHDNSIEIYKLPPHIESVFGNDLDLFVQQSNGMYIWYALQAKIMSFNGAYKDLKIRSTGGQQWNKLLLHEKTFGSKSYYLFYSGLPAIRVPPGSPLRKDCKGIPSVEELGLGIVETDIVKNIREQQISRYGNFYFKHVFPDHIDSIRKLFCCQSHNAKDIKEYARNQINTDVYSRIRLQEPTRDEEFAEDNLPIENYEFAPYRIIISNNA